MTYCWLDRTGIWEREERARFWLGSVDAVRGDVRVQMRRRDVVGGWKQLWSYPIPSGYVVSALGATSDALNKRPLEFKIFEAGGDHWHLAAKWW